MVSMFHAPKRAHVLWSKGLGGFLWFWVLWRLKHDYYDIIVSTASVELKLFVSMNDA
jgi:hypothetical protein